MTISIAQLWVYAGALFLLVISPGPVVAAIVARVLSEGMKAAIPIALAVFVGDMIWVSIAIFGVAALLEANDGFVLILRYGGAVYLVYLGVQEIRHARAKIVAADLHGARGFWPNFASGFAIIMTNPKAAFFYMVVVPRFFDIGALTAGDILAVVVVSGLVPFVGNMIWASIAGIASKQFKSETGRARLRIISGVSLILVGVALLVVH